MVTGADITAARNKLGVLWELGRPLGAAELGHLLRLGGDPRHKILEMERDKRMVSGPVSVAIEMMLGGCKPPTFETFARQLKSKPPPE
jgi:hypothetical protein